MFLVLYEKTAAKQDSNLYIPVEMYPVNNEVRHLWNSIVLKYLSHPFVMKAWVSIFF